MHMFEELETLLPITSNLKEMHAQREQLATRNFLASLKLEFGVGRSQILTRLESLAWKDVYFKLLCVAWDVSKGNVILGESLVLPGYRGDSIRGGCGSAKSARNGGISGGIARSYLQNPHNNIKCLCCLQGNCISLE